MSDESFKIEIVEGDVLDFKADVLALKYAQHFYGSDEAVANVLVKKRVATEEELKPEPGKCVWVEPGRALPVARVLFVGVPPLIRWGYSQIADWAGQVIVITGRDYPEAEHIAITLHGPGFGLDEVEALNAEVRGVYAKLLTGAWSRHLKRVSIVERKPARVERLREALDRASGIGAPQNFFLIVDAAIQQVAAEPASVSVAVAPEGKRAVSASRDKTLKLRQRESGRAKRKNEALVASAAMETNAEVENKPRVFVAMPFAPEMEDVFYYGIQNPVRQLGYICERVDQEAFTGDILEQVKMRIEKAEIVIADLTGAQRQRLPGGGICVGKGAPDAAGCQQER